MLRSTVLVKGFILFFSSEACCELWDEMNKQCKGTSIIIGINIIFFIEKLTYLKNLIAHFMNCLLYTSDAADDMQRVDLGGRRIIKKW